MRPDEYYDLCEYENQIGKRVTLLAFVHEELAGVSHLKYESSYPYFREQSIPEINDLNVFPEYRRNGIANSIMEEFENIVRKKCHASVSGLDCTGTTVRLKEYMSGAAIFRTATELCTTTNLWCPVTWYVRMTI